MSTALAIAGVTAVLRDRLNDGLVNHNVTGILGSTVTVSVLPPDRVVAEGSTETSQLNLFLYQVTPNLGWRNEGLPSADAAGRHQLSNPPLALDLHYLLSAYSGGDLHAEILLGYAMQLLHEFPVLSRQMIRTALTPSPELGPGLPPALQALSDCGLADQVEQIRITPQFLNTEESSRLWTATQSHYRPTAAYQVSVVLIEANRPTRRPLPVLARGVAVMPDLVPPLPAIEAVVPADDQPVVLLGEPVTLQGRHLDGGSRQVRFGSERLDVEELVAARGAGSADRMEVVIPVGGSVEPDPSDPDPLAWTPRFPVGVYEVSALLVPPGSTHPRETNRLACVLAPSITNLPQTVARDGAGDATITITFAPALRPGQSASLLLGEEELLPEAFAAPTTSLNFILSNAAAGAVLLARLRIDGIDSPIVDHSATTPTFLDLRVTIT
jgi:hypothetical protein